MPMPLRRKQPRRWGKLIVFGAVILLFEAVFFRSLHILLVQEQSEKITDEEVHSGIVKASLLPPPYYLAPLTQKRTQKNSPVKTDRHSIVDRQSLTETVHSIHINELDENRPAHLRSPPEDMNQCKIPPGMGAEGRNGFQALTKIQVHDGSSTLTDTLEYQPKKVLCIIITDSSHHDGRLKAIVETYAPKCDGFIAASNVTDLSLSAVDILMTSPSQQQHSSDTIFGSSITEQWRNICRAWHYVYDQYKDDFDFFHMGFDDMYVIGENLKYFLSTYDNANTTQDSTIEQEPLYLGAAVVASRKFPERRHCGSGAGYTLNRAALLLLRNQLSEHRCNDPALLASQANATTTVGELMAYCLGLAGIRCARTVDKDSSLRYLEFGIDYQARWSKQVKGPIKVGPLKTYHNIYMRPKVAGISPSTVSIHLANGVVPLANVSTADAIRRIHAIVYRHCQEEWDRPWDAYDVDGNPGYIHDATYVRRNPPPFQYHAPGDTYGVCDQEFGTGPEGEKGLLGLKKIRIMDDASLDDPDLRSGGRRRKRVMCMIYTHSNRHDRVRSIAETYGPRCGEQFSELSVLGNFFKS